MALTRATDKIIANADGNLNLSGIVTASSFSGLLVPSGDLNVGSNIKLGTASGIVTATTINATTGTFSGNLGVGGVLTYEDVTNIDSVGVVTARSGIKIGPTAGVAGTFFADGSYVTAGIITATSFSGSGANLTSLPAQATIANNADNRIITGGSGVNLNGEANLTFDGSNLGINGDLVGSNNTTLYSTNGGSGVRAGLSLSGSDQSIKFYTVNGGTERLRIDSSGRLLYGVTSSTRETSLILQGNSNSYTTNPGVLELRVGQVPSSASSLGSLVFGCTGDKIGATINAIADNADWSSGSSHPTAIRFFTTPASSTTQAERLRIDSDGTLLVAHTSQRNNFNSAASTEHAPIIQLEGTNQKRAISITAANQDGGILMLARQNGSVGANTVVSSGNQIGRVDFQASGGTNMEVAAQISAEVDGTPGDNDMPGRLLFKTTADGANSATTRVEIKQHGRTQVNLPSTSGSSSAISTAQAIVGTKHIHTVYHNFNSTNSGLVISNVIPTNSAGTVDIMGGWANGNGIIFKRFAWCASGDSHITQVFSTAASRYGVSVSISTPTIAISGDYANFTFTFSDSQGSKMEKLKIHFEYHKQFYVI